MNKKLLQKLAFILAVIFLISFFVIYLTIDLDNIKKINIFKWEYLLFALGSLTIGLILDGTRLVHLVRVTDQQISPLEAMQVVFSNYFLALLTPGATGGAIAQVMFLKKAGVPVGKATVVVLVRTILSILFLITTIPFVLHYDNSLIPSLSKNTIYLFSSTLVILAIISVLLMRTKYPEYFLVFFTKSLNRSLKRKIYFFYKEIKTATFLFFNKPLCIFRVYLESGLSLLFIYAVVPILFYGLDETINMFVTMGRMIILNLLLYFAPTPGGAGIAEGGFVMLFKPLLPIGTVGILAIVWRIMVEYLPFIIGAYFSIKTFGPDIVARISKKAIKIKNKGVSDI
ncbi:lysylphosphatidylglycerol synthase transmembrane domain-containing protein [Succinispira mobilis]|uniref:lysylphosphatidylglycerol synthase transmembrane domain-containing protein n=1 Tax=Succinispira mobilis TaxID=78120 RepID=UPI00036A618A|nr:lysylphosphatidylglycerol synthase transmembrane domain-containing protein [Succinispira mobilis]